MQFVTDKIKGFMCNEREIIILDNTHKPFYYFPNDNGNEITFNLPSGEYFTDCNILPLSNALKYDLPKLPRDEKNVKYPKDFILNIEPNKNKCSVDIKTGQIYFDTKLFNEWEKPKINFVLFHELSHCHYFTEWKCDVFAASKMLEIGFNPSQCLYSSYHCLSESQEDRKNKLETFLKKVKCYE